MDGRKRAEIERLAAYICRLLRVRGQDSVERSQLAELLSPTAADDIDAAVIHAVEKQWLEVTAAIRLTPAGKAANAKRSRRPPSRAT